MKSTDYLGYNQYLKKTSLAGDLYRKYYLYPLISKHLTGKCLDVGCGIGSFAQHRPNTDTCDINPVNVEEIKSKNIESRLIVNDKIPYDTNSYDSVLLDNVLEHIQDPKTLIEEIHRVLKASGKLIVGVPGQCGFNAEVDHKVFYTNSRLVTLFSRFGFISAKTFYTPIKSNLLDKKLRQYCMYVVLQKSET